MANTQNRRSKKQNNNSRIFILIGLGVVAIVAAIIAFVFIRNLVSSWTLGTLPGEPSIDDNALPTLAAGDKFSQGGDSLQPSTGPTPQPWDGSSRVTVLLMGLDYDDTEARKLPRTDSMMLISMDPQTRTAGILSIPRDMWVNIPGFDYAKINTAYFLGESYQMPGGGAGLAVQAVQDFIGVPINYYAQIDFDAFVSFIDEIGGVDIQVPKKIKVSLMGGYTVTADNGKTFTREEKVLKPGYQTLDGATALAYARARHTKGGDYDRAGRQQQVVDAVRSRILAYNMLPTLITKAPKLYADLSKGVKTNLSLNEMIQLALYAAKIPEASIKHGLITEDSAFQGMSPDGQSILIPIMDKIRTVRDETFATGGPLGPSLVSSDPTELMKAEAARVSVRNGSSVEGLAALSAQYFQQQGVNVAEEGTGDPSSYSYVIDITGKPYTLAYFTSVLGLSPAQIRNASYDPNSPVDVIVVLGQDWAGNNPIGR
jgi:LCP family protein required for cell wall assembly